MASPPYPTTGTSGPMPSAPGIGPVPSGMPPTYQRSLPASLPTSKVEIRVSCRNLKDADVFSKSDPMVVLFVEQVDKTGKQWVEYGRTEVVKDCLNPDFVTPFLMDYRFEEIQKLKFDVYDQDTNNSRLNDQDYLGGCECTLGSIVGENRGKMDKNLMSGKYGTGKIHLTAEEVINCKEVYRFTFHGRKLDKKDFFGLSDPFLVFSRCNEDNSYTVVHKTEVIKNNLNPVWKTFEIHGKTLCNGDASRTIKIECYDWDSDGGHDFIGSCTTDVVELKKKGSSCSFELINPKKKKKKKGYHNSGYLDVAVFHVETRLSFLDYIHGGLELCFSIAIDFTASNGDPTIPSSLHYLNMHEPNQYVQAITAVGLVCQDYDTDKLLPAFGFGARVPPTYQVMHQFNLNGNSDPHCFGIHGVLESYYKSVQVVQLYGPTNFAPVIQSTAELAQRSFASEPGKKYFVLLIVTDGVISDMERTKETIIMASLLPMSIIIVGVGSAEFDSMEELDADKSRLSFRGKQAERDIVQFVPFRDFLSKGVVATDWLTSEVLAELPDQITSYMKSRGLEPAMNVHA